MSEPSKTILPKVCQIASARLGRELNDVNLTTQASDIPGWDSLAHIDILVAIEDCYRIRFQTSELARMNSIGDLVLLIETKVSN